MNKTVAFIYAIVLPLLVLLLYFSARGERQLIERRLSASEQENQLWRSMVDLIPGGVFRVSAPDGVVTYCNDGAQQIIGYTVSEIIGHRIDDFDFIPDPDMHRRMIEDLDFHQDNRGSWIQRTGNVGIKGGQPVRRNIAIRPYVSIDGKRAWLVFVSPLTEAN